MCAADELHKRVAQHRDRLLDREQHNDCGDEEIAGVVQKIKRRATGKEVQQHRHNANAERDHAVNPRAVRLRFEHEARVAD